MTKESPVFSPRNSYRNRLQKKRVPTYSNPYHRCPCWLVCLKNEGPGLDGVYAPSTRAIYFSKRPPKRLGLPNFRQLQVVEPQEGRAEAAEAAEAAPWAVLVRPYVAQDLAPHLFRAAAVGDLDELVPCHL